MNLLINDNHGNPLLIVEGEKPEGELMLQIPAEHILNHSLLNMCSSDETKFLDKHKGESFVFNRYMNSWNCQLGDLKALQLVVKKRNLVLKLTL